MFLIFLVFMSTKKTLNTTTNISACHLQCWIGVNYYSNHLTIWYVNILQTIN